MARSFFERHWRVVWVCSAPWKKASSAGGKLGDRHRGQAADLRAGVAVVAVLNGYLEHRTAEPVEEKPAETIEAMILDLAEIGQDARRYSLVVGARQCLGERIVELGQGLGVELACAQVDDRLDRGNDAVAAGLG